MSTLVSHTAPRALPSFSYKNLVFLAALIGVLFFLSEHSFSVSQQDAFTSNAEEMQEQAAGGNSLRRIIFLSLGLAGFGLLVMPGDQRWNLNPILLPFVLAYIGWCTLSMFWSIDFGMTLRRVVLMLCYVIAAAGIAKSLSLRELMYLVVAVTLACLGIGFLTELALGTFRPWSGDYRFSGTLHPNTQGLYLTALCLASFALMRLEPNRKRWMFALGIGFLFLVLTKSRTSTAGMIICLFSLSVLKTSFARLAISSLVIGWVISVGGVVFLLVGTDVAAQLSDAALMGRKEQTESLTGRLPIWESVTPYVQQSPWTGYGYDSFWIPARVEEISEELGWGIRESHSAYFDTLLSVGFIGGVLLLAVVLITMSFSAVLYLKTKNDAYGFVFGLFLFGLINAFTESGMVMPMFIPFVALIGIFHIAAFLPRRAIVSTS